MKARSSWQRFAGLPAPAGSAAVCANDAEAARVKIPASTAFPIASSSLRCHGPPEILGRERSECGPTRSCGHRDAAPQGQRRAISVSSQGPPPRLR